MVRVFLLPYPVSRTKCFPDLSMEPRIRIETEMDQAAIRDINVTAFGAEAEADLVEDLRTEGYARLSLVAEINDVLTGHVLFSTMSIKGEYGAVDALALAPLAVRPEWQRRGIGSRLVEDGLEQCRKAGCQIVLVVGHPKFYGRLGFSAKLAEAIASPYSGETFMAQGLSPDALRGVKGTAQYPQPFSLL
jgi:putative acetyltransferase